MEARLALVSNDDGYFSDGIRAVRDALAASGADTIVLAPESEQSASSHALSLHRPLRLRRVERGVYALDGTPADCVYVALHAGTRILPRRPDIVVSGINYGMNLGQDAFYSGTIAAAREAALRGIPALAVSAHPTGELRATRLGARIYEEIVDFRMDPRAREYLWLGGPGVRHDRDPGTDTDAYDDGAASITPLSLDLTHHADAAFTATLAARVTQEMKR
jgi:5'-nucleotidase